MKRALLMLAAAGAAGACAAQSSLTLYGVVDLGVTYGRGSISNKLALGGAVGGANASARAVDLGIRHNF